MNANGPERPPSLPSRPAEQDPNRRGPAGQKAIAAEKRHTREQSHEQSTRPTAERKISKMKNDPASKPSTMPKINSQKIAPDGTLPKSVGNPAPTP
ncbi:unnamed protein product [Ilex paraguariensis]|uniref:Uncharacterized protein n=1 Tax=Ilex paraguariensis TaxID=185542 RepID=A0ABC8TQ31_9AQUA